MTLELPQDFAISQGQFWMNHHYTDVIMSTLAYKITSVSFVYSIVCSGSDQVQYQSSASLAFVRGIQRWPVNSPHKRPVTQKMFPCDDVIMLFHHQDTDDLVLKQCCRIRTGLSSVGVISHRSGMSLSCMRSEARVDKYSLLMHCIKIKSPVNFLLNEQYVFCGWKYFFSLCAIM